MTVGGSLRSLLPNEKPQRLTTYAVIANEGMQTELCQYNHYLIEETDPDGVTVVSDMDCPAVRIREALYNLGDIRERK